MSSDLAAQLQETRFQLRQKTFQLESLYESGLNLGASLEIEEIVGEFMLLALAMVDARAGFLLLREKGQRQLSLAQKTNLDDAQLDLLLEGPLGEKFKKAMRTGATLRMDSTELPAALKSEYLVVIPVGDTGLLGVIDKETRSDYQAFSETDVHLLELASHQAGTALVNARLYRSIAEEKNLVQSIFSSIGNGVISTDLKGTIVRINPAIERIFPAEERLIGRSCAHLFRRYGCTRIATSVRRTLADGQARQVDDEEVSQENLTLNARINPLRTDQGQAQGLVVALEDLTEHHRMRTMFKKYASDQVVDQLLKTESQPVLGGEEREVTILFIDLVAFTETLGKIGAAEMVLLLNRCFTKLVDVVFDHQGTVDKFIGDSIMAVFGAPLSYPDDSYRAIESALALRDAMIQFNREHGLELGLKIGMSQGPVMAGNIGSPRRMEYSVIGASVNLASRLSDKASAGEIWVDPTLYAKLKYDFDFISEGENKFKGIREPIEVFQLLGPHNSSPSTEATSQHRSGVPEAHIGLQVPMLPYIELTAIQTAEAVGTFMGLEEEKSEELKMALLEACINSIEHSQSKDRRLHIDFSINPRELQVIISDRGHGFDAEAAKEKVRARRASGQFKRGWGLKLMEELVDRVEIQSDSNGTTLTLIKRR